MARNGQMAERTTAWLQRWWIRTGELLDECRDMVECRTLQARIDTIQVILQSRGIVPTLQMGRIVWSLQIHASVGH